MEIYHVYREENKVVDALARTGFNGREGLVVLHSPPDLGFFLLAFAIPLASRHGILSQFLLVGADVHQARLVQPLILS